MNLIFSIKANEVTDPAKSILLIEAGDRYCCMGSMTAVGKELQRLDYFTTYDADEENLPGKIMDAYPAWNESFYKVIIGYSFAEKVLVPDDLYKYEDAETLLNAGFGTGVHTTIIVEPVVNRQLHTVFRMPTALYEWAEKKFNNAQYFHTVSLLLKKDTGIYKDLLRIDIKSEAFSVLVFKDGKLQLAQNREYISPEDVLYYLLKIIQQFSLSQQDVRLVLSGLIEEESTLYRELYKYFIHLEFESIPAGIKPDSVFYEHPAHYFSSLLNLASCVL
jgi:Protein of unknown function (DUF3822)